MKRLLVLSYYFPPMGMSGVQRTLKFVKYLPQFGWQPVVLTIKPRGSYGYDPELLDEIPDTEIVRTFSFDPLYLSPSKHRPSVVAKRGMIAGLNRFLIPDNKIGWIPFAVNGGLSVAKKLGIDAIYSTAPPFSSHLASVLIKNILQKPLVTDFRDAWIDYTWANHPTRLHYLLDLKLESFVARNSDAVIAVNDEIVTGLKRLHPDVASDKFMLIPHGYDPDDFINQPLLNRDKFRIAYVGTFIKNRSPRPLLKALKVLQKQEPEILGMLKISFAGTFRSEDIKMVACSGFSDIIDFLGYIPHRESMAILMQSDLLWLMMGPEETANVTPGKLFEYLGAHKPILASIPSGGAAARIIEQTSCGKVVSPLDYKSLASELALYIKTWRAGKSMCRADPDKVKKYDRRAITEELCLLLDTLA